MYLFSWKVKSYRHFLIRECIIGLLVMLSTYYLYYIGLLEGEYSDAFDVLLLIMFIAGYFSLLIYGMALIEIRNYDKDKLDYLFEKFKEMNKIKDNKVVSNLNIVLILCFVYLVIDGMYRLLVVLV